MERQCKKLYIYKAINMKTSGIISPFLAFAFILSASISAQTNRWLFNEYEDISQHINTVDEIGRINSFIGRNPGICRQIVFDDYSLEFLLNFKCLSVLSANEGDALQLYELSEKCVNSLSERINNKNRFLAKIHLILANMYLREIWLAEADQELGLAEFYMKEKSPEFYALSGIWCYKNEEYREAARLLKKACSNKDIALRQAYVLYADICFKENNHSRGFKLLNACLQRFGVDSEQPEKDSAVNLFFEKLNSAEQYDTESLYDVLGAVLATTDLNKSNAKLICFLINQRRFLATQFPFLKPENDIDSIKRYLQ